MVKRLFESDETKAGSPMATLAVGDKAPAFDLARDGGGTVALKDFKGKKLVLFFYPKADTSGCTTEAKDFTRLHKDFVKAGIAVVGVSADPVKKQDSFKAKHGLEMPLASDESHDMLTAYGVWGEKSMYGRKYMGIHRITVLIGTDGRIARVWPKVKIAGHAEEVLATAKAL
jgi:thioredoxin-dependent peroxiredoxin